MHERLTTESRNPDSERLDTLAPLELVRLMAREDRCVPEAVARAEAAIARAIEWIAERLRRGGRLLYFGAGTSGRLGILDAVECPPTFGTRPEQVVGVIAGGAGAFLKAVEGAEDRVELGARDVEAVGVGPADAVVGIAASGRTPYVLGVLAAARARGACTMALVCNADSPVGKAADLEIAVVVGPEVLSGSTRLKAGTATKLVLNMLSTGAMVALGKTYGNLMVDVQASNEKLRLRARRIVVDAAGVAEAAAAELLQRCAGEVKTAIVVALRGVEPARARELLQQAGGHVRRALAGA
ncbi:MAG: N-acetylmuramic acid 6-phosphate etherase [Planctomycetes bacterium]|nr:N-acetylmuramic acid 6-phosphate etherase [Planctomycetota bacterium]